MFPKEIAEKGTSMVTTLLLHTYMEGARKAARSLGLSLSKASIAWLDANRHLASRIVYAELLDRSVSINGVCRIITERSIAKLMNLRWETMPSCRSGFRGYVCTRNDGHRGPHVAHGSDNVCAVWREGME